MSRTVRVFTIMLVSVLSLAFGVRAEAAGQPTTTLLPIDDTRFLPRTSGICGFPIYQHFTGELTLSVTTLADGSISTRFRSSGLSVTFYSTDPAHPGTISTRQVGGGVLIEYPDGTVTDFSHGHYDGIITAPGEGVVFAQVGYKLVEIDADGNITETNRGNFDPLYAPAICHLF